MNLKYPIKIEQRHFDHSGGTKFYNITRIFNAMGKSVVIFRYGRVSQFGEVLVQTYEDDVQAMKAAEKKEKEKVRNGYFQKGITTIKNIESPSELARVIGPALFNKMGKTAVNHLDPDFNTDGMREVETPRYDENGKKLPDSPRTVDISKELAAEAERRREEEKAEAAKAYVDNPIYGMF